MFLLGPHRTCAFGSASRETLSVLFVSAKVVCDHHVDDLGIDGRGGRPVAGGLRGTPRCCRDPAGQMADRDVHSTRWPSADPLDLPASPLPVLAGERDGIGIDREAMRRAGL